MKKAFVRLFAVGAILIGGKMMASGSPCFDRQLDCCLNDTAELACRTPSLAIFGDFLYWQPSETFDWAYTINDVQNAKTVMYKTLSFNWEPGFRVGFIYNIDEMCWDTKLYFTGLYVQTSDHVEDGSGGVTSSFMGATVAKVQPYESGKIKWNLSFNIFDWELGRTFCVSDALSLRPLVGLKGGWISQTIHSQWEKTDYLATENLKNNFMGGGPKGGVSGKWLIGTQCNTSFSLFSDMEGAFMWGHWSIKDRYNDSTGTIIDTVVKSRNLGAFMVEGVLGIECDIDFSSTRLAAKLGYEIQDWLDQYQVFDDDTGPESKSLFLQGLTFDLCVSF